MNGPATTPYFLFPFTGSGGETLNSWPQLLMRDQQSGIISQIENECFKKPRISETTSNRRIPYKTELCLRFQKGNCNYGDRCNFAHGIGDLQAFVSNTQELEAKERSLVRKWDENLRIISRTKLCWRFSKGEGCPYGDRCHFIHEGLEKIKGDTGLSRNSVAISTVNNSSEGDYRIANQVNQKQVVWRTRLCNKWVTTGSCQYGVKCYFAHGESEVQKHGSHNALEDVDKAIVILAKDASSKGIGSTHKGKQWLFKWKDVEKISHIYADWVDDMPLVHGSSGNVGC